MACARPPFRTGWRRTPSRLSARMSEHFQSQPEPVSAKVGSWPSPASPWSGRRTAALRLEPDARRVGRERQQSTRCGHAGPTATRPCSMAKAALSQETTPGATRRHAWQRFKRYLLTHMFCLFCQRHAASARQDVASVYAEQSAGEALTLMATVVAVPSSWPSLTM